MISHKWRWVLISGFFIACSTLSTVLAWNGSRISLVSLGLTAAFLAVMCGVYGIGWRSSLDGWERSTNNWGAAQHWGMKQDEILRDALKELSEYDDEAYQIHRGRSTTAGIEYLTTLAKESE